jgi:predicted metal-dependent peptidase
MSGELSPAEALTLIRQCEKEIVKARLDGLTAEAFIASAAIPMKIHVCTKSAGRPVKTAATSGKHLYVNPYFWNKLTGKQKITLVLHEFWHVALAHHLRRGNRMFRLWNIACDHRINLMLLDGGYAPLPHWLCDRKYEGWSEERVFAYIFDDYNQQKRAQEEKEKEEQEECDDADDADDNEEGDDGDDGDDLDVEYEDEGEVTYTDGKEPDKDNDDDEINDDNPESGGEPCDEDGDEDGDGDEDSESTKGGASSTELADDGDDDEDEENSDDQIIGEVWDAEDDEGKELDPEEKKEELERIKEDATMGRQLSKDSGVGSDTTNSRVVDSFVRSKVNWEQQLYRRIRKCGSVYGRSWTSLDRRALANGIYQPAEIHEGISWLVAGFDVSTSIDYMACRAFVSALNDIRSQLEIERMTIVPFNETVQMNDILDLNKNQPVPNKFNICGGTCFAPVFNWIKRQNETPDVIVMFTDLEDWNYGEPPTGVPIIWASSDPVYDYSNTDKNHWGHKTNRPPFGEVVEISVEE